MGLDTHTFSSRDRAEFLRVLAVTGNASRASRAVGISYTTAMKHRKSDEFFAERWDDALAQFHQDFEEAAASRAQHGVPRPKLTAKGEFVRWPPDHPLAGQIVYETVFSDSLVPVLLKAHDPERHRDRSDVRLKGSMAREDWSDEELIERAKAILEDAALRAEGEQPDGVRLLVDETVRAEDLL